MNASDQNAEIGRLRARLQRLRGRQHRKQNVAWADGFLTAICGMMGKDDVAIDLGANQGAISARLLETGARVIAFDPEPMVADLLRTRFADQARFEFHQAAVSDAAGTSILHRSDEIESQGLSHTVRSSIVEGGRNMSSDSDVEVQVIDFTKFLRSLLQDVGQIAFIKMDIEGAELPILRAMHRDNLFEHVNCTVAEVHPKKFPHLAADYAALREEFSKAYPKSKVCLDWI